MLRLITAALVGLMFLVGCRSKTIIVVGEPPVDPPVDAEVIFVDDDLAIREIDAVRDLHFDSSQREYLVEIARRVNLGHAAQSHLVVTALDVLHFDSSRCDVLTTLARNRSLCSKTRVVILEHLDRLHFESSRNAVLRQLAKNPATACAACLADTQSIDRVGISR